MNTSINADICRAAGVSSQRLRRLDAALQAGVDRGIIPGAVMLVGRRGRIVFHEAYGFRDREARAAMPRDAIFRLSSLTKTVISLAAMSLVEQDLLRLDAPAGDFLPALKAMKVATVGSDGSLSLKAPQRPIMILDLLRHTSGLTAGHLGNSPVKQLYARSGLALPSNDRAGFLATLAQLPLEFEPGSTFAYGVSLDVLGHILEEISGMPLDDLVRERITGPLGMADTGFQVAEAARSRIAEPQIDPATGARPPMRDVTLQPARFSSTGNMVSSVPDWARFCLLFLNRGELDGNRLVSRKTIEAMISDQLPASVGFDPDLVASWGPGLPGPACGQSFGLGFAIRTRIGRATWPGSVGDFGWVGASGVYFWADPREELFAILFTQAPAQLVPHIYTARSLVYGAIDD